MDSIICQINLIASIIMKTLMVTNYIYTYNWLYIYLLICSHHEALMNNYYIYTNEVIIYIYILLYTYASN